MWSLPLGIPASYEAASGSLRPGGVSIGLLPFGVGGPMLPSTGAPKGCPFPVPPPLAAASCSAAASFSFAAAASLLALAFAMKPLVLGFFLIPSLPTSDAGSRLSVGTSIPASFSKSSNVCLLFGSGSPPSDSLPPPPPATPGMGVPDASTSSCSTLATAAWVSISTSAPGFA